MTHTSGPWNFRGMTRAIVSAPNKDGCYSTIGHVSESLMIGEQEHFANAALISAAPDMLAALHRCIAALAANDAPNCEAAKEARAAIALATGPDLRAQTKARVLAAVGAP